MIFNKIDNNSNILIYVYTAYFIRSIDISAAFDTIDHTILIKRLEYIGIVGIPLARIKIYLSEITFI